MIEKLKIMFEMQEAMNCKAAGYDWREQNLNWNRAIWIECAEMMDHTNWKWWKAGKEDREQIVLELVDIWHFLISLTLQSSHDSDIAYQITGEDYMVMANIINTQDKSGLSITESIEKLASESLQPSGCIYRCFIRLVYDLDVTFDELYKNYVGKNTLNAFRQDHGYKDGTYIKNWDGKEDNEHLSELLNEINADDRDFKDEVYRALNIRYNHILINPVDHHPV